MNILLVQPPHGQKVAERLKPFLHLEPLALEIVAGGIPDKHEVRLLDLSSKRFRESAFQAELRDFQPDLIGFTALSCQAAYVKRLAATARRLLPQTTVMVGGVHATLSPEDLHLPDTIDLLIRGEGGTAMLELIPLLESGGALPESAVFLPTASPRFPELAASPLPELPDYQDVPRARRDLVNRKDYHCIWHGGPGERLPTLFPRTASMRTSVGCPNRCSFCVVPHLAKGKYRRRSPEDVADELAAIEEEHIYFVDDEMFIDTRRAEALARLLIDRGIRKKYISWARADTIAGNRDLFALWQDAGLSLLYVGLESMNPDTLESYSKGIDPGVNRTAVKTLEELGIGLHAALMINPQFTEADFAELEATVHTVLPAEISFTVYSPPPGTHLWEETKEQFICPDPHAFYDCMHTILPTTLPLKKFYHNWAQLLLITIRKNPWRNNRVRVPIRDFCRMIYCGMLYGWTLRNIYKDYKDFS